MERLKKQKYKGKQSKTSYLDSKKGCVSVQPITQTVRAVLDKHTEVKAGLLPDACRPAVNMWQSQNVEDGVKSAENPDGWPSASLLEN